MPHSGKPFWEFLKPSEQVRVVYCALIDARAHAFHRAATCAAALALRCCGQTAFAAILLCHWFCHHSMGGGRCTQAKVHEAMAQPHLFELVQVRVSGWAGHATG